MFSFKKKKEQEDNFDTFWDQLVSKYGFKFPNGPLTEDELFEIVSRSIESKNWFIVASTALGACMDAFGSDYIPERATFRYFTRIPLFYWFKKLKKRRS